MILILGGTAEARELAAALHTAGVPVTSSLAGRVSRPRLPEGETRIGGFGGPEALARWIAEHRVRAVVDATHPFAQRISASAAQACPRAGVRLLRLERPGWSERPGDRWQWVDDLDEAAAAVRDRAIAPTSAAGAASPAAPPRPPEPPRRRRRAAGSESCSPPAARASPPSRTPTTPGFSSAASIRPPRRCRLITSCCSTAAPTRSRASSRSSTPTPSTSSSRRTAAARTRSPSSTPHASETFG